MGSPVLETGIFAMSRRISEKQPPDSVFKSVFGFYSLLISFLLECLFFKKNTLKALFFFKIET